MYEEGPGGVARLRSSTGTPGIGAAGFVPYQDLTSATNAFMTGQARAPFTANLPDYERLINQFSANIGANLEGRLTEGERRNAQRMAAERGIRSGMPGAPAIDTSLILDIINQTNQRQQQGAAGLHQAIADTPVPQLFNPMSLFVPQTLAANEFAAARLGQRQTSQPSNWRGTPSFSVQLPGGSLGQQSDWWNQPASWERDYGSMGGGRTGYFDDYSGPTAATYANLPWGNTYGGGAAYSPGPSDFSDWWDPHWAEQQPLTYTPGQGGITDWSDYGNIDWKVYE